LLATIKMSLLDKDQKLKKWIWRL